jgi:hypothetical protein
MNKDLKQGSGVKSEISPADGKPKLDEVALLGKGRLLDLLLYNRRYLTPWDYTSTCTELAESFIVWCESRDLNACDFI